MLYEFLMTERSAILAQCERETFNILGARPTSELLKVGWNLFYNQLIDVLKRNGSQADPTDQNLYAIEAASHGKEYLRLGYTVSEVIQGYGGICQAITGVADVKKVHITTQEFQQLNLSLDVAIAEAVTQFSKSQAERVSTKEVERLGFLAHELRNALSSASLALQMIETGAVGVKSLTGSIL